MEDLKYKHLVIGLGEVGKSLQKVLAEAGADVQGIDKEPVEMWPHYDFLHICIPYSDSFIDTVNQYENGWRKPDGITVIHSTVKVGTTRKLGAVHSPTHGVHPNLAEGIKTFVKYVGSEHIDLAKRVVAEFSKYGIHAMLVKNPETSELSKLGCTTRHGLMIIEQKEFKRMCDEVGADFYEAYTQWNRFYGIGYEQLGNPYIRRAIVKPQDGPIGGHCIVPNCDLIGGPIADFIKERNDTFKE